MAFEWHLIIIYPLSHDKNWLFFPLYICMHDLMLFQNWARNQFWLIAHLSVFFSYSVVRMRIAPEIENVKVKTLNLDKALKSKIHD